MGQYSQSVIQLALQVQEKYNVPASVTLSAYAVESGRGTSNLATKHNNYFGISGSGTAGSVESNGRSWAAYNSMAESFDHFGRLLTNERYSALTANATDLESYIRAYADTYAPPSDNGGRSYADQLLSVIVSDQLTVYDNTTYSNANVLETPSAQQVANSTIMNIAQKIIVAVICLLLIVGMFYFIMKAFDISLPSLKVGTKEGGAE